MIIDTNNFDDKQREEFVEGWENSGGYMEDTESSAPWCCPWTHCNTEISVEGSTPQEWGASWWQQNREEIEEEIEKEEE
jgi:hypothetical protein